MIPIRIRMVEDRPPEVAKRRWREIHRAAYLDMGEYWHANFLPRHFEPDAAREYGYKRRSSAYKKRKRNAARRNPAKYKKGGDVDLVYTGELEELLESFVTVRAFPTRTTVTMRGPRYVTLRPNVSKGSPQPDKHAELTAVTRGEVRELVAILDRGVTRGLNELREPRVTEP